MTRRRARQMIRQESVTRAPSARRWGAAGVFLAALITGALSDQCLTFAPPVALLVTLVAIIASVGAAIFYAWRASRLNVW